MKTWLRKFVFVAAMSTPLVLSAREADAALASYLKLKGQKSGEIKGSVTQKGKEGAIEVVSFTSAIVSPRDAASGLATGKRSHKPIQVVLELDTDLLKILIGMIEAGEKLDGSLSFTTKKKGKGSKAQYLVMEMHDVFITSYSIHTTSDGPDELVLELMPASFQTKTEDGTVLYSSSITTPPKKVAPTSK